MVHIDLRNSPSSLTGQRGLSNARAGRASVREARQSIAKQ
jgi:hypothetical protein